MARIWLRALLIQGAWNFKGMQNIGFLHAIAPGLKAIHGADASAALERHRAFFNTQPYLAPTLMGITLNLEEHGQQALIPRVVPAASSSLAAIGDSFFWATLKPITALICILAVMGDAVWGIVAVLILFNLVHLWIMTWGFFEGYHEGPQGALKVGKAIAVDRTRIISYAIPFLCGVLLMLGPTWSRGSVPLGIVIFAAAVIAGRFHVPILVIFYGAFILAFVWTMIL